MGCSIVCALVGAAGAKVAVVFVVPIWYTWLLLVLEVQLLPEAGAAAWSSVEQRGGRAFCRCHRAQAFRAARCVTAGSPSWFSWLLM